MKVAFKVESKKDRKWWMPLHNLAEGTLRYFRDYCCALEPGNSLLLEEGGYFLKASGHSSKLLTYDFSHSDIFLTA